MYTHVDILCYRFQRPKFTMIETIANDQKANFKLSCVEGGSISDTNRELIPASS